MGTFLSPNLHGNSYYRNPISAYHHVQPVGMIQSSASLIILPVIAKSLDFVRRRQIIIPESSMTKYDPRNIRLYLTTVIPIYAI